MLDIPHDPLVGTLVSVVSNIAERHRISQSIGPCDHLVDCGMTSMAMVDLMLALEAEFDLTIPQSDMVPANFQSIKALRLMLSRLGVH